MMCVRIEHVRKFEFSNSRHKRLIRWAGYECNCTKAFYSHKKVREKSAVNEKMDSTLDDRSSNMQTSVSTDCRDNVFVPTHSEYIRSKIFWVAEWLTVPPFFQSLSHCILSLYFSFFALKISSQLENMIFTRSHFKRKGGSRRRDVDVSLFQESWVEFMLPSCCCFTRDKYSSFPPHEWELEAFTSIFQYVWQYYLRLVRNEKWCGSWGRITALSLSSGLSYTWYIACNVIRETGTAPRSSR